MDIRLWFPFEAWLAHSLLLQLYASNNHTTLIISEIVQIEKHHIVLVKN